MDALLRTAPCRLRRSSWLHWRRLAAPPATKRQLLQLVELLVGAGATCTRFLSEHAGTAQAEAAYGAGAGPGGPPDLGLVHNSLQLALGLPQWSPGTHHRWPPAFRRAACAALLVMRGRGVAAAAAADAGAAGRRCVAVNGHTSSSTSSISSGSRTVHLPSELCELIVRQAALPVSRRVPDGQ